MDGVKAALYVDFDNIFSGLLELHPPAATAFAQHPAEWVRRLATEHLVDGPRRWLVLRCYLNSTGAARHPLRDHPRVEFAPFRRCFVQAGFEVIDCPPLTPQKKNAADIKLAIDVVDALHGPVHYDEFVIATADSDFTPLLQRLRAADRRTTLLSTFAAVDALTVLADRVVDGPHTLALLRGVPPPGPLGTVVPLPAPAPAPPSATEGLEAELARLVRLRVSASEGPVHLASLGKELRADLGDVVEQTRWFGHKTLGRAVQDLAPELRVEGNLVRDPHRHGLPKVHPT
jgi:hypothetical protein